MYTAGPQPLPAADVGLFSPSFPPALRLGQAQILETSLRKANEGGRVFLGARSPEVTMTALEPE